MMKERTELMDETLELVNGGDYGDADRDTGKEPRYKVKQFVEVYSTGMHISTCRSMIFQVKKEDGHWMYLVESRAIDKVGEAITDLKIPLHSWVTADSIES